MDDLIAEMVEAGLVEVIYNNPAIKWTNGQLIYALTRPYQIEAESLMELKWYQDKTLEYHPSRFVRWLYNGVKITNDNGGLKGKRGIFCDMNGGSFGKDTQHTENEMWDILGMFAMILNPQSIELSEEELKEYKRWYPLAEYTNQYGYVCKD